MENWKNFLTEEQNAIPIDIRGRYIYRISRFPGAVRSADKPSDSNFYYRNSSGNIENRIYFFDSLDQTLAVLFAGVSEISAYIGDVSADDNLDKLYFTSFNIDSLPEDIKFFKDQELNNISAIYGVLPDGREWQIEPKTVTIVEKILKNLEDKEYDY